MGALEDCRPLDQAWRAVGDRVLVDGMRARTPEAIEEFIRRFEETAARCARAFRIPREEQLDWVLDVLHDVAITLAAPHAATPRNLRAYVAGACRNHALSEREARDRYVLRVREAQAACAGGEQSVARGVTSQASLAAAAGPDAPEDPALPPVFARLLVAMESVLTPDERTLLTLLAHDTSYTGIAQHFGIGRPAAVSRVQRLRKRLLDVAYRYGCAIDDPADRARLGCFLRRTGRYDAARLATLTSAAPAPEDSR